MQFKVKKLMAITAIFLSGAIWFVMMRVIFYQPDSTHHHANFAIYLNDERRLFESPGYYEEVSSCQDTSYYPERRSHVHGQVNDVIHVHDKEVTWGSFFNNIGITVGNTVIEVAPNDVYNTTENEINFILNGATVKSIYNQEIESEDVLLVYHGSQVDYADKYDQIERTAAEYNRKDDPSACSGEENPNILSRFHEVLGM